MANNFSVWSKAKLGTKLSIIAFVPFVLTSICTLAALSVLADAYAEARTQQRARQMIADCETAMDSMIMGGSLMGFYLRTHDPQMLEQFWQTGADTKGCIKDLKENSRELPPEIGTLIDELDNHTQQMDDLAHSSLIQFHGTKHNQSFIDLLEFRSKALHQLAREKELLDQIEGSINEQMNAQPVQHSPLYVLLRHNVVLSVGVSIFGSLSLALLLARNIVSRLRLLTQKAMRLAMLEAPEIPEHGSDEIAQVDHVFNDMAFQLLNAIKREQAAIACAADAIISIAPDGRVLSVNNAVTGSCGWETDDLIGKPIFQFLSEADQAVVQQALNDRPSANFEAALLRRDGKRLPCLWSTSWSPGEQCTIAIVHDVSERKAAEESLRESEARTRSVMEHMPAGLLLISERAVIRFANETACRLLGKTREGLIDSQFTSLLSATNMQSPEAFVELLAQRAQPYVAAITKDDAGEGRVQISLSKFAMAKQKPEQLYLVVMVDYMERWQFEELRQRLVAMIAHDIATPLMTVQNTLGMCSSGMFGNLKPQLEQDVAESEKQSGDILQMFKNVVRFQKLASGFSSMSAAQLPLAELTGQALDVVAEQLIEKTIAVNNAVQPAIAATGDADKLAVLGATLLQTVIECASPQSHVTIDGYKEPGFACWKLSVKDNRPPLAGSLSYWSEVDVFESGDALAIDLDLILWRLLLYQCQAKISCLQRSDGYEITLRMPCFESQPVVAAIT